MAALSCRMALHRRLLVVLTLPLWTWAATVPDEVLDFDLPGGPLTETLLGIARQAGMVVSFRPALVQAHAAPPIRGRYTARQALELAARPSGLVVDVLPAGAATVLEAPATASVAPDRPAPAVAPTVAQAAPAPVVVLPRVEVLGTHHDEGLRALRSGSATRDNTPLADLPQAVSVLTAEALALQGGSTSIDALYHVPGVAPSLLTSGTSAMLVRSAQLRGLPATYAIGGVPTIRSAFPLDLAFVERIEVPKGPSAVIGGAANPGGRGGVVNLVRKQAEAEPRSQMEQTMGTQDSGTLRLAADVGGTLPGRTLWRLVGYGTGSGRTEGGYTRQGSAGALGSLAWRHGSFDATLTLQVDRRRDVPAPAGRGGKAQVGGGFIDTPLVPGIAPPLDTRDRIWFTFADAELDLALRIAPGWRMGWKVRAEGLRADFRRFQPLTEPVLQTFDDRAMGTQWNLIHDFATGPARHRAMIGLDLNLGRWSENVATFSQAGDPDAPRLVTWRELRQGLLLQDQVRLGPLRLRLGVQRTRQPDYSERASDFGDYMAARLLATNWDVGALVRMSDGLSLYAGRQHTIESDNRPAGLAQSDGRPVPLTRLRQAQAGAKLDLMDGRLAMTLEAFRTTQEAFDEALGTLGTQTDGIELELAGRPRPDLDLSLGLNLQRPVGALIEVAPDGDSTVRDFFLPDQPRRSLQALARWRLPETWWPRTHFGLALRAWSSTSVIPFGLGQPDLRLPGGARVDLSLEHRFGPWSVRAFLTNAFDRQLYNTTIDSAYLPLHPGRSLTVTAVYGD